MIRGRVVSPIRDASLLSGIVITTPRKTEILRRTSYKLGPRTLHSLQAGPLLIDVGRSANVDTALNLDGGRSSGLYVLQPEPGQPFYIPEISRVRNFLVVTQR